MKEKDLIQYINATEEMISPSKVAQVSQFSNIMSKLPLKWQKGIAAKGAKSNPYMGFVVEPYAFFLSYEITDLDAAQELMPDNYRLIPSAMFTNTSPRPSVIIGAFNVHTSVFWGSRVELYMIAENTKTGLMSWIIIDYETNTNSFDPGQGFKGATTSHSVITTSHKGDVIINVEGAESKNKLMLKAHIKDGIETSLEKRLWIEGNLSVDYGGELMDGTSDPFALIFDPHEMDQALKLPLESVSLDVNSLCGGYTAPFPYEAGCFPYAQHFVTTSIPMDLGLKTAQELDKATLSILEPPQRQAAG